MVSESAEQGTEKDINDANDAFKLTIIMKYTRVLSW